MNAFMMTNNYINYIISSIMFIWSCSV